MEVNWKELFIGLVAVVLGLPLFAFVVMGGVDQYAKWSQCSLLEDVANDDAKRRYLVSLSKAWSEDLTLIESVRKNGGFIYSPDGFEEYGQSIDWTFLGLSSTGIGAHFVSKAGNQNGQLDSVRFETGSRAVGRNHISVILNDDPDRLAGQGIVLPGYTKVTSAVFVYCENWR